MPKSGGRWVKCMECKGQGEDKNGRCKYCKGSGKELVFTCYNFFSPDPK